jgi:AcrR family transcriptional regulator
MLEACGLMKGVDMPRAEPLSRDEIVSTALRLFAGGEPNGVSLRRLATELRVTPMALYRHVQSRDDLLIEIADVLLAERGLPNRRLGWQRYLQALAEALRELLVEWPVLTTVFGRQPLTTPAAKLRLSVTVDVLRKAGFSRTSAISAYGAVHIFTIGFCALEAGRADFVAEPGPQDDWERIAIEGFVSPQQFNVGLGALLRGLELGKAERDRG